MQKNTLSVEAIEYGIVIDHIPLGVGLQLIRWLQLDAPHTQMTAGLHLSSRSMGSKDLIKVNGLMLGPKKIGYIAVLAPEATLNYIENFKVIRKERPSLPDRIKGLLSCPNIECITRSERVESELIVEKQRGEAMLRCFYCERIFHCNEIRDYN